MVTIFDKNFTMFTVLNIFILRVTFINNGWFFGWCFKGSLELFGGGDMFMGLIGPVEWGECPEVEEIE